MTIGEKIARGKKHKFYFSAKQQAVQRANCNGGGDNAVWNGKEWVYYSEWCSNYSVTKSQWDDIQLVFETDKEPDWKHGVATLDMPAPPPKLYCSNCGEHIPKGNTYFKIPGLIYKCCSKGCLLSVYTNYDTGISTGYEEDDD